MHARINRTQRGVKPSLQTNTTKQIPFQKKKKKRKTQEISRRKNRK